MKLFILTSRFPYPIEKGDKLRMYYQLKELSKHHEIVLCALTEHPIRTADMDMVRPYCSNIYTFVRNKPLIIKSLVAGFFQKLPLQVGYFYDTQTELAIHKTIAREQPDHIYCQLIRMAKYVITVPYPKTIDYMDTFSIGAARWASRSKGLMRVLLKREAKIVAKFEAKLYKYFDNHTIISAQDRDLLPFDAKKTIQIIPNGVNTEYFSPFFDTKQKYHIVFVGNMGYRPNIEAVKFLATEIVPLLLTRVPDLSVLVAGVRPNVEVLQLASKHITVSGWVEDIREAYASGSVFVAPMFIGSGLQNKILEAMSMGIPCITTALANNAIGAKDNYSIIIAEKPTDFAEKILILLLNDDFRQKIGTEGLNFVRKNFSWEKFVSELNSIITKYNYTSVPNERFD